jgi:hypothetical protein
MGAMGFGMRHPKTDKPPRSEGRVRCPQVQVTVPTLDNLEQQAGPISVLGTLQGSVRLQQR